MHSPPACTRTHARKNTQTLVQSTLSLNFTKTEPVLQKTWSLNFRKSILYASNFAYLCLCQWYHKNRPSYLSRNRKVSKFHSLVFLNASTFLSIPYVRHYKPRQSRTVNITDNLFTKQGNSSIKSAVYNHERFQIKAGYKGACTVCYFVDWWLWQSSKFDSYFWGH